MKVLPEYIKWHDHWSAKAGWQEQGKLEYKPAECLSVGFPLYEDEVGIFLAGSISDGDTNGGIYILKSCIVKRKKL